MVKIKKTIYLLLIFSILSIIVVNALDECQKLIKNTDSPCLLLLPINTTLTSCNTINISFYANSTNLFNTTMGQYNTNFCNATFNLSGFGVYTFFYSSGDSGSITIQEDINNRYYLYIVALILYIFLIWLGYYLEDVTPIVISGFLVMVIGINIFLNGFPNLRNEFLKNSVAIVLMGIGMYFVVAPTIKELEKVK